MEGELVLEGLFTHLVDRGFSLSVRDYVDALRALQAGYGVGSRARLEWLCQTLWARSEHEARQLSLLFDDFPYPTQKELAEWDDEPEEREPTLGAEPGEMPIDEPPPAPEEGPQVRARVVPPTQSGLGLPPAQVSVGRSEPFILTERPLLPLRSLIVGWRRFRAAQRVGPAVELDIQATIAEQCRVGYLASPVLVPARRNLARLVVLIDVSKSMRAWQSLNPVLVESLAYGQLGSAAVYYFDNVPRERLYRAETLRQPLSVDDALREQVDSTLLIVSDAGAARGRTGTTRVSWTRAFLERVLEAWSPVAWLNPMPAHRWHGTSALEIARLPDLAMFELTDDGLIQAVDVLRGRRAGHEARP